MGLQRFCHQTSRFKWQDLSQEFATLHVSQGVAFSLKSLGVLRHVGGHIGTRGVPSTLSEALGAFVGLNPPL